MAIPSTLSCQQDTPSNIDGSCAVSPAETKGPFPIKTPSQLVKANLVADRRGIALLINLTVEDRSNDCKPLPGVYVDIWHCDAQGYYSEYGGVALQPTDFTHAHFLRGRQMTDETGRVSFISIYPGWYPGRAPHIHVEISNVHENTLLVTQIAFPESASEEVYATGEYKGSANTSNESDNVFRNSLSDNMADSLTGNIADGYTLVKTLVVAS